MNSKKLPQKKTFILMIIAFIFISVFSVVALANSNTVAVPVSSLNVRTGPGLNYEIHTQVNENDSLNILDEENEWYQVRLADDTVGWVASWLVENQEVQVETEQFGRINYPNVNIRQFATTDSPVIGQVSQGTELQVIFQENDWTQVVYQGQVGWVASQYIDIHHNHQAGNPSPALEASQQVTITPATDVNLRSVPSLDGQVLGRAQAGATYDYLGTEGEWLLIAADGLQAYVHSDYVSASDSSMPSGADGQAESASSTHISEATIVIDAGHGGSDPGAVSVNDTYEKHLTLSTAYILQRKLQATGANVIMTRADDSYVELADRAYISNVNYANAFISLHYDSSNSPNSKSGTTSYYYTSADQGLANTINPYVANYSPLGNNGIQSGDYQVLRDTQAPSVLLELGFMNNTHDLSYITSQSYQEQVAEGIYQGLLDYFS